MYANDFTYHAPETLDQAVALLQRHGDAKLLAGGQSLLPMMKLRLVETDTLVDLGHIAELRGIADDGDALRIGAGTPYARVIESPRVQQRCPLLAQTLRQVGDPQVRYRGTIGGSLAHADPAGDLPAAALALDAEILAHGPQGARTIPVRDFFTDLLTTALGPAEVLTAVRFSVTDAPHTGTAYVKHRHPASGYAVVGVAAVVTLDEGGSCRAARVGITGASTHAARATSVEQALAGAAPDAGAIQAAVATAADGLDLMADPYASADYRAHLTRVLAARALQQAVAVARAR